MYSLWDSKDSRPIFIPKDSTEIYYTSDKILDDIILRHESVDLTQDEAKDLAMKLILDSPYWFKHNYKSPWTEFRYHEFLYSMIGDADYSRFPDNKFESPREKIEFIDRLREIGANTMVCQFPKLGNRRISSKDLLRSPSLGVDQKFHAYFCMTNGETYFSSNKSVYRYDHGRLVKSSLPNSDNAFIELSKLYKEIPEITVEDPISVQFYKECIYGLT